MQKKNFKPKEDKAKHCLMRRAKISHFLARVYAGEEKKRKRRKKKEEEKKKKEEGKREKEERRRKKRRRNPGLEISYSCMELLFGIFLLVWKVWNLFMDLLVRKLS